ncbi:DMT family transporter [Streptomyces sp. BV129]|uniref:DMT family transporter n=1 Tax=Streptomyces sp. BV129 TaxID=2849671 RepID=UPI001C2E3FF5|nr:DMT family transporter [Streptomyces sp. BV129]MBV1949326.1 DMT family transporter [Streptomyces sp. BV129]
MNALALSVLLSFVSAVAYAGGAVVQERVAVSCSGERLAPLRRPGWWAALGLNGLGGVLHVVALAFGPLSLVQPLGALTIVFALPMAALFVGRRAGATAWRGAVMATAGLAGLLSLVGSAESHSLGPAERTGLAVVTGGAIVALMAAARAAHRHPAVRSMLLATGAGTAFGMSSVFTKTVAVDWSAGVDLAALPSLGVIAVLSAAGVFLSQAAYRDGGLAAPLATLTVVNPVLAAVVGIAMFGETFRHGTTGTVLALGCAVVTGGGLILLTTERLGGAAEPGREAESADARLGDVRGPDGPAAWPAMPAGRASTDAARGAAVPDAGPEPGWRTDADRSTGAVLAAVDDIREGAAEDAGKGPGGGGGETPAAPHARPLSDVPLCA